MASNRIGRINEEIQRELSSLFRTLKDPRVQVGGGVNVRDGDHAALHARVLEGAEQRAQLALDLLVDAPDSIACHKNDLP